MTNTKESRIGRNEPCNCGSGKKHKRCCGQKSETLLTLAPPIDPAKMRKETEQLMRQISRIAGAKDLSIQDLNELFVGKSFDQIDAEYQELESAKSPEARAMDLIFEAFEAGDSAERMSLALQAMAIHPHLPDAWLIVDEVFSGSPHESVLYLRRAVAAGEEGLGKNVFKESEGHFWLVTETRPYMRAKAALAEALWEVGEKDEAIQHFEDCLRLNPNDNQGLRDVLTSHLLSKGELERAEAILERYKDDSSANHAFNLALLLFRKNGKPSVAARKQLELAAKGNPYVVKYLLGRLKSPKTLPSSYSFGSKDEALIYVSMAEEAWKTSTGALGWLAEWAKS